MSACNKMHFSSLAAIFITLIGSSEAVTETTAIIVLSIATAIPALFILTCCCSLIFVFHYRNKIPIFKSMVRGVRKGGTAGHAPKSAPPPANYPGQQTPAAMPPPASNPSAPPAGPNPSAPPSQQLPGTYEMEKPVEVDDVVVPVTKD